MTSPAAIVPALANPADPATSGYRAAVPGDALAAPAPVTGSAPAQGSAAAVFAALLQGLGRGVDAHAAAPGATTTPTAAATVPGTEAATGPPLLPETPAGDPPQAAAFETADGPPDGQPLQAGGKELPAASLDQLLASIGIPAASAAPPPAAAPAAGTAEAQPTGPPPASPGAAQSAATANASANTDLAALPRDSALPAETDSALPQSTGARAAQAAQATAQREVAGSSNSTPTGASDQATAAPTPERPVPPDFHARLATLLQANVPPASADAGTGPQISVLTAASPIPPGSPSAPTSAMPMDSLPALKPLDPGQSWSQSLGDRLLLMADRSLQSATLRLEPEHLGPLQVRIQVAEDGAAQVLFSAHHAHTRDALEQAIPRLRELFAEQGLNLSQANVDSGRGTFAQRDLNSLLPSWRWGDPAREAIELPRAWQLVRDPARRVDVLV